MAITEGAGGEAMKTMNRTVVLEFGARDANGVSELVVAVDGSPDAVEEMKKLIKETYDLDPAEPLPKSKKKNQSSSSLC